MASYFPTGAFYGLASGPRISVGSHSLPIEAIF